MPFPLPSNPLTADAINVVGEEQDTVIAGREGPVTWSGNVIGDLFPVQDRQAVTLVVSFSAPTIGKAAMTRKWGGIGVQILGGNQGWTVVT